jgi:hypothetical protein
MSIYRGETSMTHMIFLYIQDHPGAVRRDIITDLDLDTTPNIISNLISRLARMGFIVNRGGVKSQARWYAADHVEGPSPKYFGLSEQLLTELHPVPRPLRASHLARRLEEIFG